MAKVKRPLISEGDSAVMRRVIGWCSAQGLDVRRTSPSQIKVGPLNCWPDKGAWNRDDDPKGKKGGIPAFMTAVEEWMATQALVPTYWPTSIEIG
ncbi:hypothetical protein [Sphingomonas glacialis]|uniref:Uncharacterized protein n=1 Tax=Sphingomonas glacialis TaxID=658225 RepID=A0A502G471_9SPHN|nr:hypothetical protein [Sphingomonas glacialis]TPG56352.1 hypothetical protein EAH76_01970 [Sphingomonas glacialis]